MNVNTTEEQSVARLSGGRFAAGSEDRLAVVLVGRLGGRQTVRAEVNRVAFHLMATTDYNAETCNRAAGLVVLGGHGEATALALAIEQQDGLRVNVSSTADMLALVTAQIERAADAETLTTDEQLRVALVEVHADLLDACDVRCSKGSRLDSAEAALSKVAQMLEGQL